LCCYSNNKIVEIIFVRTDDNKADRFRKNVKSEVFERHSKYFVWDKDECANAALTHQIKGDEPETVLEEKHWTSVGRVLEVSLDSSTDARAFTSTDVNTQVNRVIYPEFKDMQNFLRIFGSSARTELHSTEWNSAFSSLVRRYEYEVDKGSQS